jgi:TPR repeat protein
MNGYGVEKDREKAIVLMSQLAETGDPKAQWNLAELYARENVDQQDQDQSVRWYQQAADNGFPAAQAKLGLMYALGQGVEQDYAVATMYWTQAAQAGDPEAQYNLAWIMLGKAKTGSTKNRKLAVDWLRRAAEQAVPDAQIQLGLLHATGEMGEVDLVEAYQWFSLAEKSGSKAAEQNRRHAETLMSKELLTEAKTKLKSRVDKLNKYKAL